MIQHIPGIMSPIPAECEHLNFYDYEDYYTYKVRTCKACGFTEVITPSTYENTNNRHGEHDS